MLIKPHGGKLINLFKKYNYKKLTDYQVIVNDNIEKDIFNIGNGIYSPLKGFLDKKDFESVLNNMRLTNGILWPIPIVMDITKEQKNDIESNNYKFILLKNKLMEDIAILEYKEIYLYDKVAYKRNIFGTVNQNHPGVNNIEMLEDYFISGDIILLKGEKNHNNEMLNKYFLNPKDTRKYFKKMGWKNIVAFQTRNPPHRGHEYIQKSALENCDGLFINPVIGKKKSGDFNDESIVGSYEILINKYFKKENTFFSILPLNMKYAGPREAILHAIIRQNFGCSHIIIGRDHAGVDNFYGQYDAQNIFNNIQKKDLKINILRFENASYCHKCKNISSDKTCPHNLKDKINISGTKIRNMIMNKEHVPSNFMRKEISDFLKNGYNQFVK